MKIHRKYTVTIIADGSHCTESNAYGWAFFITYGNSGNNRIFEYGGGYDCPNSEQAENQAINNAIDTIINKGLVYRQKIVIVSDCTAVKNMLDRKRLYEFGASNVRLRHVKSHQPIQQMKKVDEVVFWHTKCHKAALRSMRRNRDLRYILKGG